MLPDGQYIRQSLPKWPRKLRILVVPPNQGGCAYYRSIMPNQKLHELYSDYVDIKFNENPLGVDMEKRTLAPNTPTPDIDWADVVMVNNISNFGGPYTCRVVGVAKEKGKFVHFDTDDLLTELYEEHRLFEVYRDNKLGEMTKYIYSTCDLVTVTQRKFAERIAPFCKKILAIVKNCIDYNLPHWNSPKVPHGNRIHIGWAGGIHHRPDVVEFATVPHLVNQKVGREKVIWDFYGRPNIDLQKKPEDKWQLDAWDEYRRALLAGFKGGRNWNIHPAAPPDSYGHFYANMDIAIAPLKMNNFNDSKSEIKVAECGRYKVPLVASDVGCYDETIIDGKTGFLIPPNSGKHLWVKRLSYLINNPKKCREMGENLHAITEQNFNINKVVHHRLSLYEMCFEKLNYDPFTEEKSNDQDN